MNFRVWNKELKEYSYEDWILTSSGRLFYNNLENEYTDITEIDFSTGLYDVNGKEIYMNDIVIIDGSDITINVDTSSLSLVRSFSKPNSNLKLRLVKTKRDI